MAEEKGFAFVLTEWPAAREEQNFSITGLADIVHETLFHDDI